MILGSQPFYKQQGKRDVQNPVGGYGLLTWTTHVFADHLNDVAIV